MVAAGPASSSGFSWDRDTRLVVRLVYTEVLRCKLKSAYLAVLSKCGVGNSPMRGLVVTVDEGNVELDSTMAVDIVLPSSRSKVRSYSYLGRNLE